MLPLPNRQIHAQRILSFFFLTFVIFCRVYFGNYPVVCRFLHPDEPNRLASGDLGSAQALGGQEHACKTATAWIMSFLFRKFFCCLHSPN